MKKTYNSWLSSNYIPKLNEVCYCTDCANIRIGDGINLWRNLKDIIKTDANHNFDEKAHLDIREQISQLTEQTDNIEQDVADIKSDMKQIPLFVSSVDECTDTAQTYVLPDGYIYAYMEKTGALFKNQLENAIDTDGSPFNNGLGYEMGYLSSNGSFDNTDTSGSFASGFIPYNLENTIRISGLAYEDCNPDPDAGTPNALRIFFYAEDMSTQIQGSWLRNYVNEGSATFEFDELTSTYIFTFDFSKYYDLHGWYGDEIINKAKYIRVSWHDTWYNSTDNNPSTEHAYVTFDEEIAFGTFSEWTNTGGSFAPTDYGDRISKAEQLINSHEDRIKVLETSNSGSESGSNSSTNSNTDIPAYIKAEAEDVMSRLIEKQGNRVFNMIAMSDFHYSNYAAKYGGEDDDNRATLLSVAKATSYMLDRIHIDAVATLGDNTPFGAVKESDIVWGHKWHKEINEILAMTQRPGVVDFRTVGNHDRMGGIDSETGEVTPILPDGAVYQYIQGYNRQCDYLSAPVGYGYKDFEGYKLRVIVLNTAECEGKGRFSEPHYGYFIGNAQYNWLIQTLDMSTKEDASEWQILILSHHRADDAQVAHDGHSYQQNAFILANILNAYKTGGSYSGTIASENISVSCNFEGKNQAYLIGQIHGHHHSHAYSNLYLGASSNSTQTSIMAVGTPTTSYGTTNPDNDGISYTSTDKGTADETTFSVYAIDLDEHKIYSINYGKGIDREIDY